MFQQPPKKQTSFRRVITAFAGFLAIASGAVYVILSLQGNGQASLSLTQLEKIFSLDAHAEPLNRGKMVTFVIKKQPKKLPALKFQNEAGKEISLDDWRGKTVLINLWATWCAPCRHEMPSLARLDDAFKGKPFDVVAVSIDRKGVAASGKFLKEIKVERLGLYADPTGKIARTLRAYGLPVSILVDGEGREIGRLTGPAEWDSADAIKLIKAAMDGQLKAGS